MLCMLSEANPILHTVNRDGAHMGDRLIFTSDRPLFDGARILISQRALRLTQGSRHVFAFPLRSSSIQSAASCCAARS